MPTYNFKERFAGYVLEGSKTQTLRARRKYPARVGDTLYLFSGLRTRYSQRLRTEVCTATYSVRLSGSAIMIYDRLLDNIEMEEARRDMLNVSDTDFTLLTPDGRDRFAWLDGFRTKGSTLENPDGCFDLMVRYWQTESSGLPWVGDLIKWEVK